MPVELVPPPALAERVDAFWRHDGAAREFRVVPDGCMDFWFDLESGRARVIGTMTEAAHVVAPAGSRYFGVRFRSGVAARYVTESMHAFVDTDAPLEDVTHAARFGLVERLVNAPSDAERVAQVASFLASPHARVRPTDHRVSRAVHQLRTRTAPLRIATLAAELGLGERQLERLFSERVGIGPKQFARIARLERALALMGSPLRGQAVLAARAGYADESHLIREFRRLTGATPAELARERHVGFVQSVDAGLR